MVEIVDVVFQDTHAQVVLAYLVHSSWNDCDVTSNYERHYVHDHFFCENGDSRQCANYRPDHHAEHKLNAGLRRNDACAISKEYIENCRERCILKKNYYLRKYINNDSAN